ncbi:HNH endonuclease signature motif containing protein, partial [Blastococcus atacamensis]|uniref:HNH endonuclease signature motif containing protein n=1 Tax=Blastococcus atacamensis TaxID=2070508 RepID=UPI0012FFE2AB
DALVQLCDVQLAAGNLPTLRTFKPHVVVTIPLEELVGSDTSPAVADLGFAAISAARARWLACDGNVTRIVVGPEGQPMDLGRTRRVVPPHLRRAVEHADRHCVFAGCDAPSHWCDVHHLVHWAHGGDTELHNLALLCERHHTKVHHGFRIERDADGRWHTYRPDGTEILVLQRITQETADARAG